MQNSLPAITTRITEVSEDLLRRYSRKNLYALRVSMRRCRSILKHAESHRARGFRKAWGGFAAATNDARDWDVFLITARELLSPEDYREFARANRSRVRSSHLTAIRMLRSEHWSAHLRAWRQFLQQPEATRAGKEKLQVQLDHALNKARIALRNAMERNDDRSWHKLRIAVKEVRYLADTGVADTREGVEMAATAAACRPVQTLLGKWHDTVVQLGILDQLPPTPIHKQLRSQVRRRQKRFLAAIRENLSAEPLFR